MRARSFSQYVLKVHSRCDLSCDHCYVYEHADQSWRHRPRAMPLEIVRAAAARIAEHAAAHRLSRVHVVLHGGEPLLLGLSGLRTVLSELRRAIAAVAELDLRMQTNGVLLTREIADLLVGYGVKVGVSLDGDRAANDRHRRFASGASSHPQVSRALALLREPAYRPAYAGILCTVDVRNDPDRVYQAVMAERPPRVDLLLPHATWDQPPPGRSGLATPYADWLHRVYRRWTADGRPVPIRLFDSLLATAVGRPSETEAVGLEPADVLVIETDGSWEQADSLKTAFDGAPATGFHVLSDGVDDLAGHPGLLARGGGLGSLCATCRACAVVHRCGGGLYAHRYRTGTGFANPSVYCADLKGLIDAMDRSALPADAPAPADVSARADAPAPADAPATGRLPTDLLDDLATGYGGEATVDRLRASQLSITRMLLAALADGLSGSPAAARAWAVLGRLDGAAPRAVGTVLGHPFLRPWLARRLHRPGRPGTDEAARLGALAAAAALRAGTDAELSLPARNGVIALPTLGRLVLPAAAEQVLLTVTPTGFTAGDGATAVSVRELDRPDPSAGWQPLRRAALDGLDLAIEDLDPERDCYEWPVTDRLADPTARAWQRTLAAAWAAIRRDTPDHVPALGRGLRAVVPLRPDPTGREHSATARHAFGAVGIAGGAAPDALAVLLVHEWQHVKLGALLDLRDLVAPGFPGRLSVGWRPDPRPVEGALQGTYAHLGIAEIWRARAVAAASGGWDGADDGDRPSAREVFERYRRWTADAADALLASEALTDDGVRFVRGVRRAVDAWQATLA